MVKDFILAIGQVFASMRDTCREIVFGTVDDTEDQPGFMQSREHNQLRLAEERETEPA